MTFLSFANLWWLAAAGPIIFLYLLRARREPQAVSSLMLWQRVERELEGDPALKKLQRSLLLLLQLLMILLLTLSLLEPVVDGTVLRAGRVTILLDGSASMKAKDLAPSRFVRAKNKVRDIIKGLPQGTEARLLLVTKGVSTLCGLTKERQLLLAALENAAAADCVSDLREAVDFALNLDGSGRSYPLFFITDGAALGKEPLSDNERLTVLLVGEDCGNVAITEMNVRRSLIEGSRCQAFARIANFSREKRTVDLAMTGRDIMVDNRSLELKPGENRSVIFSNLLFPHGKFSLKLISQDGPPDPLLQDNEMTLYLAPMKELFVFVDSDLGPFFLRAFQALPNVTLAAEIDKAHLIVTNKELAAPNARCIYFVSPKGDCAGFKARGSVSNPQVGLWQRNHPILNGLSLDTLFIAESSQFLLPPWALAIVECTRGRPLLALGHNGKNHILLQAFSPLKSDLPLTADFPLLLANLVAFVRQESEAPARLDGGQMLSYPAAKDKVRLFSPQGKEMKCRFFGGRLRSEPLLTMGEYRLVEDKEERPLHVSFPAKEESDLRRQVINTKGKVAKPTERHQGRVNISWLFTVLALLLALTEYALWSRGRAVR